MANGNSSIGMLLVLAVAGGAAGGAGAAFLLRDDRPVTRADRGYDDSALRAELREIRESLQRIRLEGTAAAPGPSTGGTGESSTIEVARPGEDRAEPTAGENGEGAEEKFVPGKFVESLRGRRFTVTDSDAFVTRLSMEKEQIDPTIKALEAAIKADPSNPELYHALASAHVAKLAAGVAVGPAAGPVYMQAIQAYDKALSLAPDHWDARFNKAFTTSMAPEFVGLRPMSIRMFEDLVQRQESLPKNDSFRRTYMRLGTLYKDAGNAEKARQIWTKGLERFPDDQRIKAALAVLEE